MLRDDYLLDFVAESHILGEQDLFALRSWASQQVSAGRSPLEQLMELNVLVPTATRTLELIQKKFIVETDARVLFGPTGLTKLLGILNADSAPSDMTAQLSRISFAKPIRATLSDTLDSTQMSVKPGRGTKADFSINGHTPKVAGSRNQPDKQVVLQAGATLGKCLLTGQLGKGGYGIVFSALHQTLGIPVAVKVLLSGHEIPDPELVRQLQTEAQLLARLNHPNIIRVLDFDDVPLPYVVMEHVEGPSLADLIATTGGIWTHRAIAIFSQVILGLKAAWAVGVVHRDIKPGNILLTKTGEAKIADLGLAMSPFHSTVQGNSNSPIGTCGYMAPEQARTSHDVDFRADMYSLGATFYHTVTGELPFVGRSARELLMKHAMEPLIPACVRAPNRVDAATSAVIDRMMAKDPNCRYGSYDLLLAALAELNAEPSASLPSAAELDINMAIAELETADELCLPDTRKRSLIRRIFQFGDQAR